MKFATSNTSNKLTPIQDVERGLKCNCICECCEVEVIAKQGNKNEWHFAHSNGANCKYSNNPKETDLHLLAKFVFQKNKILMFPALKYGNTKIVYSKLVSFDKVDLEKRESKYTPDAIGYIKDKKVWIEFAVTHFTERNKIDYCRGNKIALLEVDLSNTKRETTEQEMYNLLRFDTSKKRFIYSPVIEIKKPILIRNKIIKDYEIFKTITNDYYEITETLYTRNNIKILGDIIPVDKKIVDYLKVKLKSLEEAAKRYSEYRLSKDMQYVNDKIKDRNHLINWFNKRKEWDLKGALVPVPNLLQINVDEKLEELPEKSKEKCECEKCGKEIYFFENNDIHICRDCEKEYYEADHDDYICEGCSDEIDYSVYTSNVFGYCEPCNLKNNSMNTWESENREYS